MPYWFDGNNLIGQTVAQARDDRGIRRAFLKQLSDCSTGRGGRFLVFFDGDDPDRSMAPRGVQVRFSAPLSADDAMIEKLAGMQNAAEIIIVTNDAGLRSRCRNAGARTMDWSKFSSLVKNASSASRRRTKEDAPVNVDDWMRYFGLDDDSSE